ncbi:PAS domain-containing protein [Halorubrum trapanicum]|uniref:PAS domain-containing protein n=1 Tax=Halorubrum trapanicum TaxID=29284 RepID=UPI003C701DE0
MTAEERPHGGTADSPPPEPTLHLGEPVDAAWGKLPEGTRVSRAIGDANRDDGRPERVLVRLREDGGQGDRLESVRDRYPDATVLAYSVEDDPDAAIDASRLGVEYVSGRRLAADGETLADRAGAAEEREGGDSGRGDGPRDDDGRQDGPRGDDDRAFLEPFVRIVSDRRADLEEQIDALLELGRDYLGLSIGYSSRIAGDRLEIRQYSDGTGVLDPIAGDDANGDGSVPLELTYCRRTVGGRAAGRGTDGEPVGQETDGEPVGQETDGEPIERGADGDDGDRKRNGRPDVFAFTDPEAAGMVGDPAYEQFGFGSYVGGRVVVDEEVFGTICFLDPESRDRPFDAAEELFVELLAEWLGRAIERRLAFEEREAAVERYEETLERIDDAFFALDDEWRFTYVNETAATLLERDPDELLGADVWEEFPAAIGEEYERNYRRAMAEQETVSFEAHYEPLDLWTEVTAYPSQDGLSVFFVDVTDRKRREETLERLLGTVERIQRESDAEAVAERLVEAADEVLDYRISAVRLFDAAENELRLAVTSDGIGEEFAESRRPRPPGEGITGQVFERGETWVCDDIAAVDGPVARDGDAGSGERYEYHGMRSFVAVPLADHGVFVVGSTEPDAFDESDVTVLELLATNAVATMDANDRRERLRTYENALKNVDDMVCVLDREGTVTYATRPFVSWVAGREADGRRGLDGDADGPVVGRRLDELVSPTSRERVADAVAALAADGGESDPGATRTVDLTRDRDGDERPRHGELRLSALSGPGSGVVGSLSDTTDLRRTRAELSTERDRFRQLFERIPDPVLEVVMADDETVIDGINPAFESQFGVDESAVRGQRIAALDIEVGRLSDERGDRTDGESLAATVREQGFVTAELRRQTVDGPREFLFRGFSYETEGTRRAFGIYTDITDRKRRERYVRIVNRILRHNLRNELNVVFGFAGEIAELADDERVRDYAERIEATGRRLIDVTEGAAAIRRVVEEGYVTDPEPVSVSRAVDEAVARHAERRPDARIEADVPDGVAVRGDDRFATAIDHLVENAVDHGGDEPRVAVTAERDLDEGVVTVTVADDGPGIPDAVREVITGDREVTQLRHNTGVGLWIVAWVVEAYGGAIRFGDGLDGRGAAVTLALPAAE